MEIPAHLINEHYDDRFFDVVNAIEEAKYIHFAGNQIVERIVSQQKEVKELTIGELGFGAGRNLAALIHLLETAGITDTTINFNSVELHPITSSRMALILNDFRPEIGDIIDLVVNAYKTIDISKPGWQQVSMPCPFGTINLNLWIGEALEMATALNAPCDAWLLDGHGPKKNPEMWREELLMAVGAKTAPGGSCTTFTVAGEVKRNLTAAGFTIQKRPGTGGKKSVLRGVKSTL